MYIQLKLILNHKKWPCPTLSSRLLPAAFGLLTVYHEMLLMLPRSIRESADFVKRFIRLYRLNFAIYAVSRMNLIVYIFDVFKRFLRGLFFSTASIKFRWVQFTQNPRALIISNWSNWQSLDHPSLNVFHFVRPIKLKPISSNNKYSTN